MNDDEAIVSFPVNKDGWILLFRIFGKKTILRAIKIRNKGRVSDENSQHRMEEIEAEGGVKVKSKLYDTSKFL